MAAIALLSEGSGEIREVKSLPLGNDGFFEVHASGYLVRTLQRLFRVQNCPVLVREEGANRPEETATVTGCCTP